MEEDIPEFPPEEKEEEENEIQQVFAPPASPPQPSGEPQASVPEAPSGGSGTSSSPQGPISISVQGPSSPGRIELGGSLDLGLLKISRNRSGKKTEPEPEPSKDRRKEQQEKKEESPAELLSHLENLTRYLPDERRREYMNSDMRLRLEALKDRLYGRPSLRQQLSRYIAPDMQEDEGIVLKPGKIESTLSFMGDLSTYLPNPEIGVALHHRITQILKTMKRDEHGE